MSAAARGPSALASSTLHCDSQLRSEQNRARPTGPLLTSRGSPRKLTPGVRSLGSTAGSSARGSPIVPCTTKPRSSWSGSAESVSLTRAVMRRLRASWASRYRTSKSASNGGSRAEKASAGARCAGALSSTTAPSRQAGGNSWRGGGAARRGFAFGEARRMEAVGEPLVGAGMRGEQEDRVGRGKLGVDEARRIAGRGLRHGRVLGLLLVVQRQRAAAAPPRQHDAL